MDAIEREARWENAQRDRAKERLADRRREGVPRVVVSGGRMGRYRSTLAIAAMAAMGALLVTREKDK